MSDNATPPGQPPGGSAGPAGPGEQPYVLWILVALALVMLLFIGIAIWAGAQTR